MPPETPEISIAPIDKESLLKDLRNNLVDVLIMQLRSDVFPEELYEDSEVKTAVGYAVSSLEEKKRNIAHGIGVEQKKRLQAQIDLLKEKFRI